MSIICCAKCDWTGHTYMAESLPDSELRALQPGETVPFGVCPECKAVLGSGCAISDDGFNGRWNDPRAERGNLTKFQRDCLVTLLARLDPRNPGFTASNELGLAFLSGSADVPEIQITDNRAPPFNKLSMSPYMTSWVYPLLQGALYGETFPGQRRYVADDAANVRTKIAEARQVKA